MTDLGPTAIDSVSYVCVHDAYRGQCQEKGCWFSSERETLDVVRAKIEGL